ncbi:uncharacterized protein PAC_17185 [Phialocephala subalpina]|uniref:Piwi domain-containing protein n=1 Tax=Phialocephala subalpina TaxID=576137 RepID=A0A1L7XQG2_9HELO|nr:uncharacterized protein PAC_17185 [Phialocephala subalpina]
MILSSIIFEGQFDLTNLDQLIPSHNTPPLYHPNQDINTLNIIAWHDISHPPWQGTRVKSKFFHAGARQWNLNTGSFTVPAKTGFFTSIRPGESKLLLSVNATTGAFLPAGAVLQDWIPARFNFRYDQIPTAGTCKGIKGLKVTFDLLNPQKQWSVHAVSDRSVLEEGFEQLVGGPSISVYNYMRQKYTGATFNPNAMCVNLSSSNRDVWHPADKLRIVPSQYIVKTLEQHFADQMVKAAERRPLVNEDAILDFALKPLGISPPKQFWNFGTDSSNLALINTGAGILGSQQEEGELTDKNGVYLGPSKDQVRTFGFQLLKQLPQYNVQFSGSVLEDAEATHAGSPGVRRTNFAVVLEQAWTKLGKPTFVLISLATENVTIFSDIKYWTECVKGIPSVCIKPKAIEKNAEKGSNVGDRRLLGNVYMKVNFKLGGINQIVLKEDDSWMDGVHKGTMIVAAIVATFDDRSGCYLGSVRLQNHNTEERVLRFIDRWTPDRKKFPKGQPQRPVHILFYQDGVSESQYAMVYEEELPQIIRVAKLLFYLQSHDSPIGTARPGHYVVIHNGSSYTLDQPQQITMKLCFSGSRATVGFHGRGIRDFPGKTLDQYKGDRSTWKANEYRNTKTDQILSQDNPWHPNLDNTMFYL